MSDEVEVSIGQASNGKAVIEGKTSVPFKTFVSLILQRKVQTLFKTSQDEPVIVGSELLTKLASAPDDKMEDRGKLVLVTLGFGMLVGLFLTLAGFLTLSIIEIHPTNMQLGLILGVMIGIAILGMIVGKLQGMSAKQRIYENMEKVTEMLSK